MTTSEAIEIAMTALVAAKQKAIKETETFNKECLVPAMEELERETGIRCSNLLESEGLMQDHERPDNLFNEALEVLNNALTEFQDFEDNNGEEETWELQPADSLED